MDKMSKINESMAMSPCPPA